MFRRAHSNDIGQGGIMVREHCVADFAWVTASRKLVMVAVAALAGTAVESATAQEAAQTTEQAELTEVVVTGSRITRTDLSSDTPVVSLSSENLQNTSEVGIDQQLSKLPQFVPGANQFTSSTDIQATPTNSPGIATVNLRGLGSNRTLVLLDGRRTQPNNASLVVDLNTIPATAVESVEIITGGAAATYGADAVAGVVNFKLKKNYEGVTLDARSGQTSRGDGKQTQVSALLGSNFADQRGNAIIGLSYSKREEVFTRDRPFFAAAYSDPGTSGDNAFPVFGGFSGTPTQAAVDSVFTARGYAPGDVNRSSVLYFNTAATTAGATLFSVLPGVVSGSAAPGYTGALAPNYKLLNNGGLSSNTSDGFLSLPLTRYSMFAAGHYDVNDRATAYVQVNFDENETRTRSATRAAAINQWSVTIPYDAAHPVPAELATLLNSRTSPTAPWMLNKVLDYMGPRTLRTTTDTHEIVAGVRGDLSVKDWTYDVFVSRGSTNQQTQYTGFADLGAYQALINLPNYGANAIFNNGRTGLLAQCTSGLNPFVNTPVSQDCIDIIESQLKASTVLDQQQLELNIQGSLFELPTGDLRFAAGVGHRKNEFEYLPDRGLSTQNITSLTVGLFDTSATTGAISVKEAYAELLVPLLKDKFLVESLELNAGYRHSDYDTATGVVSTWKVTADWNINQWIRFRGGRQVANRAPNVAELFQPAVFQTAPWPDHDPCSNVTRAPYGNVASNPNRAQVQALCSALSGGFPIDNNYVGNQPNYFPIGRDLTEGNPDVESEDAKTWTIGVVLQSPFESEALRSLSVALDYYAITIDGAIAPATTQTVYQNCFNGVGTNPTYDPNNEYCRRIIRLPSNGFWVATRAQYQNLGMIETSGFDAQVDWSMDTPFIGDRAGTLLANINFNYLESYDVQNFAGGPVLEYAGTIGAPISSPPYGAQLRWKLYTTLAYSVGPASVSLGWQHLPEAKNVAHVTNPTATTLSSPSYDRFDLAARWSLNTAFEFRLGVDNVLDAEPNRVGIVPGVTTATGETDLGAYDVIGRRYYGAVTARF
jgi:iron complex outermembrane receptor protein